jgi:tetratricopeptide (TPR) repeat protein
MWARLEEEMQHPDVALAIYQRLLRRDHASLPHAGPSVAEAARRAATLLEKQGKAEEAARVKRWSEAFSALEAAGGSEPAKALPQLRRAQALCPESPCIQVAICQGLPAVERGEARLKALLLMTAACNGVRDCPYCSSLLRHQEGSPPLPAAALLAATHDSGGARFLIALAETMADNGYDAAAQARQVAAWRKVVDRDPTLVPAWEALRDLANRSGSEMDLLTESSRKVAELRQDNAEDWMQLAQAYLRTNRRAEARAAMEKAHDLDPRFDPAEYGLVALQVPIWGGQVMDGVEGANDVSMLFQFTPYFSLVSGMEPW